jgi:hypothetical protein
MDAHIFHMACDTLRGELGIAVLSLFLTKDNTTSETFRYELLPIHWAVQCSCVDVLKFLHDAYPESISILDDDKGTLLHQVVSNCFGKKSDMNAKMRYLCEMHPTLINVKNFEGYRYCYLPSTQ